MRSPFDWGAELRWRGGVGDGGSVPGRLGFGIGIGIRGPE